MSIAYKTQQTLNAAETEEDKAENIRKTRLAKLEGMISYGDIKTWSYSETLDPFRKKRNEYYAEEGGCNPSLTDRNFKAKFSDNCEIVLEFTPDKFHIGDRNDLENTDKKSGLPSNLLTPDPELEKDYHIYLIDGGNGNSKETIAEGAPARSLYWELYSKISIEVPSILIRS